MGKTENITKCEALLQDNSVNQHLSKDTSPNILIELLKFCKTMRITIHLWNRIHPTKTTWLQFLSSKILWHSQIYNKNNMSILPMVSACGTTYNKFITIILQNYCGKMSSFVKHSTDFIQKINKSRKRNLSLVWCQCSLHQHTTTITLQVINSNYANVCKILTEIFSTFLEFTITNCIFCLNKKFHKQLQGAAIGLPVSPSFQICTWNTWNP